MGILSALKNDSSSLQNLYLNKADVHYHSDNPNKNAPHYIAYFLPARIPNRVYPSRNPA